MKCKVASSSVSQLCDCKVVVHVCFQGPKPVVSANTTQLYGS